MKTAKQEAQKLLRNLPDDSSYEDIQYHLYVLEKVRCGEARAEAEGTMSHEEAQSRLSTLGMQ